MRKDELKVLCEYGIESPDEILRRSFMLFLQKELQNAAGTLAVYDELLV